MRLELKMYEKMDKQMRLIDCTLSDTFTLDPNNRWVTKAKLVPWEMADEKYSRMFRKNGRKAKDIRKALGALLIQQDLKCSDEDTVQNIKENPYLQYFIGMDKWSNESPFDPSLMVWFRKRLSSSVLNEINEEMCRRLAQPEEEERDDNDDNEPHGGTMIIDATCAPADISYPTDANLLAEAVEKTDTIIDELHEPYKGQRQRPRTYRIKSGKVFRAYVKNRNPTKRQIRTIIRIQLGYLKRNIGYIEEMLKTGEPISERTTSLLDTIRILYEQQLRMYKQKVHSVENRIVSLSQPHVRPIPRGKANARTEFGAKVAVSVVNGYTYAENISYDNFNEGVLLSDAINKYKEKFGMLPSQVLADTIYRNQKNRAMCKEMGIRISGLPLGRRNAAKYRQQLKDYIADCASRNEIEGKIGTAKTRYGMNRIRTRLAESGKSVIVLSIMAMNLSKLAKAFLCRFLDMLLYRLKNAAEPA